MSDTENGTPAEDAAPDTQVNVGEGSEVNVGTEATPGGSEGQVDESTRQSGTNDGTDAEDDGGDDEGSDSQ